jgi:hypothetical protein
MASCEVGALTIEPFEVSRWRGVRELGSMGFQSSGVAEARIRGSRRGGLRRRAMFIEMKDGRAEQVLACENGGLHVP